MPRMRPTRRRTVILTAAFHLAACSSAATPEPTEHHASTSETPSQVTAPVPSALPSVATTAVAPEVAPASARTRVIEHASLEGTQRCGRFSSEGLQDVALLEGRLQLRFLPGGEIEGDETSQRILITRGEASIFVGAYEMNMTRGADFLAQAQARAANFSEVFDAASIAGAHNDNAVFGVPHEVEEQNGMVFLAHGTVARSDGDVLDVALVVSRSEVTDLDACTRFALSVLDTLHDGPRAMPSTPTGPQSVRVSYAQFGFTLPPQWRVAEAYGIHDFARIHFVRTAVFPERPVTLQMALDSAPGEWSTGAPTGTREGHLLGVPVTWNLTDTQGSGAFTLSTERIGRDQAVAAIRAPNAALRDEAIHFAESVVRAPSP